MPPKTTTATDAPEIGTYQIQDSSSGRYRYRTAGLQAVEGEYSATSPVDWNDWSGEIPDEKEAVMEAEAFVRSLQSVLAYLQEQAETLKAHVPKTRTVKMK